MKHFKFIVSAFVLIVIVSSCKKEEVDDRDKFVGTWKGNFTMIVPDLEINSTDPTTQTITKSSLYSKQIIFTESGSTDDGTTANVNGNSYTYDEYTETENIDGTTISIKVTGIGSINGTVITESGTLLVYALGEEFPGTWSSTLNKQ